MKKLPLTAIIIYNSAHENLILPQTLDSLVGAEQIVKYDVGTEPIVDFSQVRNKSLELATQNYVLFVDADEVVTKGSWREIRRIVERGEADLVSIFRSDVFLGREMQGGEASCQRLIRMGKTKKMKFVRPVHEMVEVGATDRVLVSQIKLLHYSHQSITEFIGKIAFYAQLEAKLRHESDRTYLLFAMIFFPPLKFLVNMLVWGGYRDGLRGVVYAMIMSLHSLFVRVYGWELSKRKMLR